MDAGLESLKLVEERLSTLETYWEIPAPVTVTESENQDENTDDFRILSVQPVPR